MSEHSAIQWTDTTWNPVRGCTKVSPGCKNCYAETFAERWRGVPGHPYEQGFDLRLMPEKVDEPLRWSKPRLVFVNSMSDLFQDGVPDTFIDQVFAVMALADKHTFQVLSKRAERMHAYLSAPDVRERVELQLWEMHTDDTTNAISSWPLRNVWLGVSVENQHFADERIPLLLQTPSTVRFISAEPLLEFVNVGRYVGILDDGEVCLDGPFLDWVIVGGESGPKARAFKVAWARSIVAQCREAGVSCFVKQLGSNPTGDDIPPATRDEATGRRTLHLRQELTIRDRKGGDMAEWPSDLRVREFPSQSPQDRKR